MTDKKEIHFDPSININPSVSIMLIILFFYFSMLAVTTGHVREDNNHLVRDNIQVGRQTGAFIIFDTF